MFSLRMSWKALFQEEPKLPNINGPAFVFGAAPDPVVHEHLLRHATIVTANASQLTLETYGVTKPHITFMRTNMSDGRETDIMKLASLRNRQTGFLVLMAGPKDPECRCQLALLSEINYRFEDVLIVTPVESCIIHNKVLSARTSFLLRRFRPSMGFQAVLFCLAMQSRQVAIAGISFRKEGCSFHTLKYERKHVIGDLEVLARIRQRQLPVYAMDEDFAADSDLPLWRPVEKAV